MAIRCSQCGAAGKRIRVKSKSKAPGVSASADDLVALQKIRARQRAKGLQTQRNRKGRFVKRGGRDAA